MSSSVKRSKGLTSSKVQPIKENESLILKKHIDLINCKIAQLSKNQQKYYNTILISATDQLMYNPQNMEGEWFTIDSADLCNGLGVKRIKKAEILAAMTQLNNTQFVSVSIREDTTVYSGSQLVSEWQFAEVHSTNDITEVKFKLPDYVKDRLINPKVYAKLPLKKMNKLSGRYAYALGPFLKVNFSEKFKFSRIVSLTDYRAVVGVPEDQFVGRNNNLVQRALVQPLEQLRKTEPELVNINYEIQKKGRNITGIKFWNKRSTKSTVKTTTPGFQNLLNNFAFKDTVINKLTDKYGEERVRACLAHTFDEFEKRKDTANAIKDPKAYARSLIEGEFDYEKSQMSQKAETEVKIQRIQKNHLKIEREQIQDLLEDYQVIRKEQVDAYLKSLDEKSRELLMIETKEKCGDLFNYQWETGGDSQGDPFTHSVIIQFITENYLPAETFENYVHNKTGRIIKDVGGGLFKFIDDDLTTLSVNVNIDPQKEIIKFLDAFKNEAAKIIVDSPPSKIRRIYVVDYDTSDSDELQSMVCENEFIDLDIEKILGYNDAKMIKSKTLKIEKKGQIFENEDAVCALYSMLPSSLINVISIIS